MTDFQNTWEAVFKPHHATGYFETMSHLPFEPGAPQFRPVDGWWMAEMSRLVYRRHDDEPNPSPDGKTRGEFLEPQGFIELEFFDSQGSQASLITPRPRPRPSGVGNPDYVVVAFRGTDDLQTWFDFNLDLASTDWPTGGKVHSGFKEAFDHIWGDIEVALPDGVPVVYTGHSLGGALATLAASHRSPLRTYTFGSPRVGDGDFARTIERDAFFRVVNNQDIVTQVPVGLLHVGILFYISTDGALHRQPDYGFVRLDLKRNLPNNFGGPPQAIADHAPVNYVKHLERAVTLT